MDDNTTLLEKREELKREVTAGMGKTFPALILNTTGRTIRALTRNQRPVSLYYSAVVLALLILLPGSLISALLHEAEEWVALGWRWALSIEGCLFGSTLLGHILVGKVLADTLDHLIDNIESTDNLTDLQQWLADACSIRKPLALAIPFCISYGSVSTILTSIFRGAFIGYGLATECLIFGFFYGVGLYYVFWMLRLPPRLSRYQYRLYELDPVNSQVIGHLSRMLNTWVYVLAAWFAFSTFVSAFARTRETEWFGVFLIFVGWIPTSAQFISNQVALSTIVTTVKWQTLNELQAKISKLRTEANPADKEAIEAINRLMDLHDRVRATRNSTLNLRTGLNFLNQLMLPFLAFLLANIDRLLEAIR
jgi:hypothetical protein